MDDDWEEYRPETGLSLGDHMIAGSLAGLAEHVVMFPVDTVKAGTGSGSATQLFRHMVKAEGGWRMWRGVHTMLVGCLPAHAAYFGIYEAIKAKTTSVGTTHSTLGVMLAGATAVCVHDSIMTPMDVMKQRLQLGYYRGILDCAVSVARTEGLIAFYRSYPTTLVMNVPFHGTLVMINETLKSLFGPRETHAGQLAVSLTSGFIAGGVAAVATNPLDVAKTRLQTQAVADAAAAMSGAGASTAAGSVPSAAVSESAAAARRHVGKVSAADGMITKMSPSMVSFSSMAAGQPQRRGVAHSPAGGAPAVKYYGMADALRGVVREGGWKALFRGAQPRFLVSAPSAAISWTAYEAAKSIILTYKA